MRLPGAPRLLARLWRRLARGVLPASRVWPGVLFAIVPPGMVGAEIVAAEYLEPTTRYPHAVLGDDVEWGALRLKQKAGSDIVFRLPQDRVYEDLEPRLADLDGDGDLEVIVVESQAQTGASLVVYDETGKVAATPHIGTSFRWLAPIGAADLDGDGFVELAYIDRPHLAKTLRVWRFSRGKLQPVASLAGLTNHRIGEDFITGGVRDCSGQPELITADAGWQRIVVTRLERGILNSSDVAPFRGQASVNRALRCSVK